MSGHPLGVAHATRNDPVRVLEEMKRLAVEQLGGVLGGLYAPIADMLHESSLRSGIPGGRRRDEQALLGLRQRSATYVMRFRQQISQGFDDFRALRIRHRSDLPLGLVADSQLDFHLAGQRLAESIEQRFARPLEMMNSRLDALAAALDVPSASNPIGASRLVAAFIETYRDAQLPETLHPLLFRQYEQELARVLGEFFGRVNTMLATAGYGVSTAAPNALPQPVFDTAVQRHDPFNELVPALARRPQVGPEAAADLAELREQLHAWRGGLLQGGSVDAAHAPKHRLAPRRELRVDEVVSVASLLQSESPDVYARALATSGRLAEAIRDHLTEGARRLGLSPDHTRFSVDEEDAIDLVAMLFEALFRTHALQERARRLYARLVLPYVKVALHDDTMFVQPGHPARRLLDAITEACEGNDAATAQDRELLERAAAVSQRVVAEFNEDTAVFELAHAELDELLQQQRRRVELQEDRAAKATFGRERLAESRAQADRVVERRLATSPLTQAVAEFLITPWRHHLVQTLLRDGADSARHAEAARLGIALVEADRLAEACRGRELADGMIALEPAIVQCLATSGLDDTASRHGMAWLVSALANPDNPRQVHPMPARSADEGGDDDARLWLAGGTDSVPHDAGIAALMRHLQPGQWLRMIGAQGEATAVKVAWISPLTSRLLLVSRRGLRVLVASAEELAGLVSAGRLVVGAERTPFDEAMRQLHQRLDHAVGQR